MPPYVSGYINPCFSFCLKPASIPELHHLLEILCSRRVPSFPRLCSRPCQNRGSCFGASSTHNGKGKFPRNSQTQRSGSFSPRASKLLEDKTSGVKALLVGLFPVFSSGTQSVYIHIFLYKHIYLENLIEYKNFDALCTFTTLLSTWLALKLAQAPSRTWLWPCKVGQLPSATGDRQLPASSPRGGGAAPDSHTHNSRRFRELLFTADEQTSSLLSCVCWPWEAPSVALLPSTACLWVPAGGGRPWLSALRASQPPSPRRAGPGKTGTRTKPRRRPWFTWDVSPESESGSFPGASRCPRRT